MSKPQHIVVTMEVTAYKRETHTRALTKKMAIGCLPFLVRLVRYCCLVVYLLHAEKNGVSLTGFIGV